MRDYHPPTIRKADLDHKWRLLPHLNDSGLSIIRELIKLKSARTLVLG